MATAQFFVGVDGGATRCRARLRDSSGRELGRGVGPASNIYIDFDAAMRVVRETIDSAIAAGAARQAIAVGLSLAGLSEDTEAERVAATLPGFARVVAVNDAVAACEHHLRVEGFSPPAYYLMGMIYQAAGNRVRAEDCFHKTVYLDPMHDEALLALALLAERRGDHDAASNFRRRAERSVTMSRKRVN